MPSAPRTAAGSPVKRLRRATTAVPLLITAVFVLLTVQGPAIVDEYVETLLVDYRFKVRNFFAPPPVPADIVIVAVDEKSLATHGRWPWSRQRQAALIEKIFAGGARVVAVDIFYPEAETAEGDAALAAAIARHPGRTVMALGVETTPASSETPEAVGDILFSQAVSKIENFRFLRPVTVDRVLLPPDVIAAAAVFGHVFALPDRDGKLRWEHLYVDYQGEYLPSLALQTARIALGAGGADVAIVGGAGVRLAGRLLPTDKFGRLHIDYAGKEGRFTHLSAGDVLDGRTADGALRDKIVLVGTTAMATYDLKVTPFSANMTGVEKNATVVANILAASYITAVPTYLNALLVLLAGIGVVLVNRSRRALYLIATYVGGGLLLLVGAQALFSLPGLRVTLVYPLATLVTGGAFVVSYRYFGEERQARVIRRLFSSYVTERVVNELIKNPEMARLGGARRTVTILMADIQSFTAYAERHSPETVVGILNQHLEAMTDVILKWEGTLDKFVGDAIVVFWGAPLIQENHPELALRCALEMTARMQRLQEQWRREGKEPLKIGIGLNTGEVIVGNVGAEGKKMDYTVIGDPVNLCARVEALTRTYAADILITEHTLGPIEKAVRANRIGHVRVAGVAKVVVKGKQDPVAIYRVETLEASKGSAIAVLRDETTTVHLAEK